jgi:GNAT superfamily N-acetyltransferase
MTTGKETNEQTDKEFVIEEVTDFDAAWPELERLVMGIIDYHRPWDSRSLRHNWAPIMREYMEQRCVTLVAAGKESGLLGFLSGTIRSDFGIFEGTVGHIDNVFVVEQARGQGIGRGLFQRFEQMCLEQGAGEISLDVALGNDLGEDFWHQSGFGIQMYSMRKSLEASHD